MLTQRSTLWLCFPICYHFRSEKVKYTGVLCRPLCAWTTGWSDPRLLTYLETSQPRGKMTKYNTCARSGDPGFWGTAGKMARSGSPRWEWACGRRPNSDGVRRPVAAYENPAGLKQHVTCSSRWRCAASPYCACAQNVCQLCRCI